MGWQRKRREKCLFPAVFFAVPIHFYPFPSLLTISSTSILYFRQLYNIFTKYITDPKNIKKINANQKSAFIPHVFLKSEVNKTNNNDTENPLAANHSLLFLIFSICEVKMFINLSSVILITLTDVLE
ncbi:MAG: hypothetical protein ACI3YG_09715 [Prevotella sp.]